MKQSECEDVIEIPPMPLRPAAAPEVCTTPWTPEDWTRWEAVQRQRQRLFDEWESKYRHQHSINVVTEMAAHCYNCGDYDRWTVYTHIVRLLKEQKK
jgi:hypothetical protein